jgi:hypothetical protein
VAFRLVGDEGVGLKNGRERLARPVSNLGEISEVAVDLTAVGRLTPNWMRCWKRCAWLP